MSLILTSIFTIFAIFLLIIWGKFLHVISQWLISGIIDFKNSMYSTISCVASLLFLLPLNFILPIVYSIPYSFFISALIITINTDLQTMLISRYMTIFLIPIALFLSYLGFLPISWIHSLVGCITAYLFLSFISYVYFKCTKVIGLGLGDIELLSFIGAWLGIFGWWFSLCLGSFMGSCIGIGFALYSKKSLRTTKLPFAPFLVLGAITYSYLQWYITFSFN